MQRCNDIDTPSPGGGSSTSFMTEGLERCHREPGDVSLTHIVLGSPLSAQARNKTTDEAIYILGRKLHVRL